MYIIDIANLMERREMIPYFMVFFIQEMDCTMKCAEFNTQLGHL